ncbi:helix-turn-helix transcriptional regulator [Rubinisphaera sp. JC750]|uniref:helix-turn-helix transcriptional regulator n=1 Tax=Rubinisphaera sp. JC750 TaxID=2898658 RepID=UPI001F21ECF1|nr:response regulator transcription factor [Rubinisphaera sp. JC750]
MWKLDQSVERESVSPAQESGGRMLLIESSPMIGVALAQWFGRIPFISGVEVVSNATAIFPLVERDRFDFVILPDQTREPPLATLVRGLRNRSPESRIVFLLAKLSAGRLAELNRLSPSGMVDRQARPDDVRNVLRDTLRGDRAYTPNIRHYLDEMSRGNHTGGASVEPLSARQKEVLRYLALGHTVKEVAAMMHLSVKSVDSHKYRIMKKLDLHDRVHLARYAIREGLCEV